jgi:GxxExxY protein
MEVSVSFSNQNNKQFTCDNCNYSINVMKILNSAIRVYEQLGPGHNERIYHKALVYELNCLGYNLDTEMNIIVKYKDSKGNVHCLESERIDIFIHEEKVLIELKAIQKQIQAQERGQLEKYINELNKLNIFVSDALVINFPQPNNKEIPSKIDYFVKEINN